MSNTLAIAIKIANENQKVLKELQSELEGVEDGGKKAGGGLKDAGDRAKEAGDKAETSSGHFGGLGASLKAIGTTAAGFAIGGGLLKLPGFFAGAAQAAADDEAATLRLQQTIRNLGGDYDATLASVNAAIDAGQKLAFSDDEVRDSYQYLVEATDDSDEALRRQKTAMDLARGANISLQDASKLLGKTSDENTNTLRKMGIEIADGATAADVLASVQKRFAGQSDAYAKSTAGQFAQAKLAMGEIVEGIGGAVLPILTKLGTALAANLPAIQAFVGELGEKAARVIAPALEIVGTKIGELVNWIVNKLAPAVARVWGSEIQPKIVAFGRAIAAVVPHVVKLAREIGDRLEPPLVKVLRFLGDHQEVLAAVGIAIGTVLVAAFTAWAISAGAAAVATIAATLPVIAIIAAIALLALGVIELVKHWDDLTAKYPIITTVTEGLKTAFSNFVDFIRDPFLPTVQSIYDKVSTVVGDVGTFVGDNWHYVQDPIDAFVTWINDPFIPAVKSIYDTVSGAVTDSVGFVTDHWHEIQDLIEPAVIALHGVITFWWDAISVYVDTTIHAIKDTLSIVMALIHGDWDGAWNGLKTLLSDIWNNGVDGIVNIVSDQIDNIKKFFSSGPEGLIGFFAGIGPDLVKAGSDMGHAVIDKMGEIIKWGVNNLILEPMETGINWTLGLVAKAVGVLKGLADAVPGPNPFGDTFQAAIDALNEGIHIPRLEKGGIVTKPTLALIGEEGPEAVVPLSGGPRPVFDSGGIVPPSPVRQQTVNHHYEIHLSGLKTEDPEKFARTLVDHINREQQRRDRQNWRKVGHVAGASS